MEIAYVIDEKYVGVAITSIMSVILNSSCVDAIYVVCIDIPPSVCETLRIDDKVRLIHVPSKELSFGIGWKWVSRASYGKILLPKILDSDKVLLLDADTIATGDMNEFYSVDISDRYAAVVKDYGVSIAGGDEFFAGQMLLNLKKIREEGICDKMIGASGKRNRHGEQSVFNEVFGHDVVYLPPRFCICPHWIRTGKYPRTIEPLNKVYGTSYASVDEAIADACLLHFWGPLEDSYKDEWVVRECRKIRNKFLELKFFDFAFTISVDESRENIHRAVFEHTFGRVPRIVRGFVNKDIDNPLWKISFSHSGIVRMAKAMGWPFVTIFEDDALPMINAGEYLKHMISIIPDNAKGIYWGHCGGMFDKCDHNEWLVVREVGGAHGYTLFRDAFDDFISMSNGKNHVDSGMSVKGGMYAPEKSMFIQYNGTKSSHGYHGYVVTKKKMYESAPNGFLKVEDVKCREIENKSYPTRGNPMDYSVCISINHTRKYISEKIFLGHEICYFDGYTASVRNGIYNCSLSHAAIIRMAKALMWPHVTIFEDDAWPVADWVSRITEEWNGVPEDARIFVWGWLGDVCKIRVDHVNDFVDLMKSGCINGSHAYTVFASGYDEYIKLYDDNPNRVADRFYNAIRPTYVSRSKIFDQLQIGLGSIHGVGKMVDDGSFVPIPKPSSVIVDINGNLGNQMWIYAFCRFINHMGGRCFLKNGNIGRKFRYSIPDCFPSSIKIEMTDTVPEGFKERDLSRDYSRYEIPWPGDTHYIGYFQNIRYVEPIRYFLEKEFKLPDYNGESSDRIEKVRSCKNPVYIGIRRGIYLSHGWDLPACYYEKAIDYIRSKIEDPTFFVVSEDVEWAKNEIHGLSCSDEIWEFSSADKWIIEECRHAILPNSSFSWWFAWLGRPNSGIVVAPSGWVGGRDGMIPDNWTKIKPPFVSLMDEKHKSCVNQIIRMCPVKPMSVLEIGCYAGEATRLFAESDNVKHVWCVDMWGSGDVGSRDPSLERVSEWEYVERSFDRVAASFPGKITKIKAPIDKAISEITGKVDIVYIDGKHDFDTVSAQISTSIRHGIRFICGHDYGRWCPDVVRAVDSMCKGKVVLKDSSWFFDSAKTTEIPKMRSSKDSISGLVDLVGYTGMDGMSMVEVGSFAGESAGIFKSTGKVKSIWCVDTWKQYQEMNIGGLDFDAVYRLFKEVESRSNGIIKHFKGGLSEFVSSSVIDKTDMVYIDGDHRYDYVVSDIENAKKLNPLFICGHDYDEKTNPEVVRAVNLTLGVPVKVFRDGSWMHPFGQDSIVRMRWIHPDLDRLHRLCNDIGFKPVRVNSEKCLIVGSNPCILSGGHAEYIDGFDGDVIWINGLPRKEHEMEYGKRIDILCRNAYCHDRHENEFLIGENVWHSSLKDMTWLRSGKKLTTGFICIGLALSIYKHVECVGFVDDEVSCERLYLSLHGNQDPNKVRFGHDMGFEHRLLEDMCRCGAIRIIRGKSVKGAFSRRINA